MKVTTRIKGIEKTLAETRRRVDRVIKGIQQKILSLPDNPRIKRLGGGCFTMRNSDLGDNWSVKHYDFKAQYEILSELVERSDLKNVIPLLRRVVDKGFIWDTKATPTKHTFHPDVRKFIEELL
jgi:hypothetical protein